MNPRDRAECPRAELISALLDGELAMADALEAVDHLLDCAACASFYRRSRTLDAELLLAAVPAPAATLPPPSWAETATAATAGGDGTVALATREAEVDAAPLPFVTAAAAREVSPAGAGSRRTPGWSRFAAAAALLLAAGGAGTIWWLGPNRPAPGGAPEATAELVTLPVAPMDEQRFVAIAAELLGAEPWYRDAMIEVLAVAEDGAAREGSTAESGLRGEDLRSRSDRRREGQVDSREDRRRL